MSKSKRSAKKPSVKVKDLRPKKNPKGGLVITKTVDKSTPILMSSATTTNTK
ncbi:MAG TPA: hypothetical protein VF505_18510 [Thermoanaerobaculia bacterium]